VFPPEVSKLINKLRTFSGIWKQIIFIGVTLHNFMRNGYSDKKESEEEWGE